MLPEYKVWESLINRCENANNQSYRNYGGRGIKVAPRWRSSFTAFLEDMGQRPSPKHTIERIDNDGHYEPGNCRWATRAEQNRNRRNNRFLTFDGRTQHLSAWARELGITPEALSLRIHCHGLEHALTMQRYRRA